MMTAMHRALCLVEEERCQGCRHPTGGKDDKNGVRQRTPSRAEGHTAATMNNRSMTEEDEAIMTLLGLHSSCRHHKK